MFKDKKIVFVGAGNMAEALIKGIINSKAAEGAKIIVSDINEERLNYISKTYSVEKTMTNNSEAVKEGDIIILAVKPQVMDTILTEINNSVDDKKLIISIAAGIATNKIKTKFNRPIRLIRVMPNTPALIGEGATAIAVGKNVYTNDAELVKKIFESVGKVVLVEEKLMDAVTGLSGSGPAYIFAIIEALSDGGVKMGLPRDIANTLTVQTVLGAAKMLIETGKHPGQLKDMVTSPGGTTIAALHALETGRLKATLINAVEVATKKARELGNN